MKICFRRHGDWDRDTGDLTPQAKKLAWRKVGNYDFVFSSPIWRCIETARLLSGKAIINTSEVFTDCSFGGFSSRTNLVRDFLRRFMGYEGKVLIVSHSNLVSVLNLLYIEEKIPEDLDDLPEMSYLEGFDLYV